LSGPLLDRLDLLVPVQRPSAAELAAGTPEPSAPVRERVLEARARQERRLHGSDATVNAHMDTRTARATARLSAGAEALLGDAYERSSLSARGLHRVVRVARTIADLAGSETVEREHARQALAFRQRKASAEEAA
jgi:magnesium chelatase family protein